jgi:hypothetical protein
MTKVTKSDHQSTMGIHGSFDSSPSQYLKHTFQMRKEGKAWQNKLVTTKSQFDGPVGHVADFALKMINIPGFGGVALPIHPSP